MRHKLSFSFASWMFGWGSIVLVLCVMSSQSVATPTPAPLSEGSSYRSTHAQTSGSSYMDALISLQENNPEAAEKALLQAISMDPNNLYLQRELASFYFGQKSFTKAIAIAKSILEVAPKDDKTWFLLGQSYQFSGDTVQAKDTYRKTLLVNPEFADVYLNLAFIEMNDKNSAVALQSLQKYIQLVPDNPLGYYLTGEIYVTQKNYPLAKKYFTQALDRNPSIIEILQALLNIARLENNLPEAKRWFSQITATQPTDVRSRLDMASFLGLHKEDLEAKEVLCPIASQEYQTLVIRLLYSDYIPEKRVPETVYLVEKLIECGADIPAYYLLAGLGWKDLKNISNSLKYLEKVPGDSELYRDALPHLAEYYLLYNRPEETVARIQRAFQNDMPQKANLYYMLILGQEGIDDWKGALQTTNEALALFPDSDIIWFEKGIILTHLRRSDEALIVMMKVISLNPNHVEALNYIGYTFAKKGVRLDEAERLIQKALSISPENPHILDSMGWVYYQQGKYYKALEYLEKSISIRSDEAEVFHHAGDAALKLGNKPKAIRYYQKALELSPEVSTEIQQKLRQLHK